MKIDHLDPRPKAFIDFETQSSAELLTVSKYAKDPSTRALTCCVKLQDTGEVYKMGPYLNDEHKSRLREIAKTHVLVAHNAPFDAAIWEHAEGLGDATWFDTLPCARAAGLPGALDKLSKVLGGRGKDKMGEQLIKLLCVIRNNKIPAIGPAHGLLMNYNMQDVEELEFIYERVKDFGEPGVIALDRVINDRGIPINVKYCERLLELFDQNVKERGDEFDDATDGVNPGSHKQVREWIKDLGFDLKGVGKFAFREFLKDPGQFYIGDGDMEAALDVVKEAMEMRREIVRVGRGKAETALQLVESDGRIRDQHVYGGAHTLRWAGRALQIHNFPSVAARDIDISNIPLDYDEIRRIAEEATVRVRAGDPQAPRIGAADILSTLLRHMIQTENLLVADYGAVEARGAAYVAGCNRMLELYGDHRKSVYLDMAKTLYGRDIHKKNDIYEYAFVKSLVLGCNYGMSGQKFDGLCKIRNVNTASLASMGMTSADAVKLYRTTYPELPAMWRSYHEAIHGCVERGEDQYACKCEFKMVGPDMHVVLPSGRPIVYRNARIADRVPGYVRMQGGTETVPTVIFDLPRMHEGFLYGSRMCENIVQAMCRDLLAYALLSLEQRGLNPIMHVHDEIVCEAPPDKLTEFLQIMSDPPEWARGFPLLVEGYSGPIWTKQPKGFTQRDALNGVIV